MKKNYFLPIYTILLITLQSCIVSNKPNVNYLSDLDYKGASSEVIAVNLPMWMAKPFVKKALRQDGESQEVINLVKKIKKIRVMTLQNPKQNLVKNLQEKLKTNNFEEWMTVKHDGDNVNINVHQSQDNIKKMLLIVHSKSENQIVLIDLKTDLSPEQLTKLLSSYQD